MPKQWAPFHQFVQLPSSFLTQILSIRSMTGRLLSVENTEKPEDKRNFQYFVLHLSLGQINQAPPTHPTTILLYHTPKSTLSFLVIPTKQSLLSFRKVNQIQFLHKLFLDYSSGILGLLSQCLWCNFYLYNLFLKLIGFLHHIINQEPGICLLYSLKIATHQIALVYL